MKQADFEIRLVSIKWLNEVDEQKDYCAHGKVFVRIGDEIITAEPDLEDWTVSATALNLMRTAFRNYKPGDFAGQLVPCCGFDMLAEDDRHVHIHCCPVGHDWEIIHEDDRIIMRSANGTIAVIGVEEYRSQVRAFADRVREFYQDSKPKAIAEEECDRKGYTAFWNEWEDLRKLL
jgi:hypothetical protein